MNLFCLIAKFYIVLTLGGALLEKEEDFLSLNWKHVFIDPTMREYYKSLLDNQRVICILQIIQ